MRVVLLFVLILAATVARPAAAAPSEAWTRLAPTIARFDSLMRRLETTAAVALLDSLAGAARAANDVGALRVEDQRRIVALQVQGQIDESVARGRDVVTRARTARDTVTWCEALLRVGRGLELRQRNGEAMAGYREALRLSRLAKLEPQRANALTRIGYVHLYFRRDEVARQHFDRALRISRARGDRAAIMRDLGGLARAEHFLGRLAAARASYPELARVSEGVGSLSEASAAWVNLGQLELEQGDPDLAPAHFRRALAVARRAGDPQRIAEAAIPLAQQAIAGADWMQADSLLTAVLPGVRGLADRSVLAGVIAQLSMVRKGQDRPDESLQLARQAGALCDSVRPFQAQNLATTLWWTLKELDRWDEARELAERAIARANAAGIRQTTALDFRRAWSLSGAGRFREALPGLLAAAAPPNAPGIGTSGLSLTYDRKEIARTYRALGRLDSALVWYGAAARAWEAAWASLRNPDLRLVGEDIGHDLGCAMATLELDPRRRGTPDARALRAFAATQRFRARILNERVLGPGPASSRALAAFDAAAFRSRTLRAGEVWLDFASTRDTTLIVAVTRDSVRAWYAPSRGELDERLVRFAGLLERPVAGDPDAWRLPAAALGRELFGPVAAWLARAPRVLIAPDVFGNRPLGMLIPPGARDPLALERDVAFLPSAPVLAAVRARAATIAPPRESGVAIARTTNDRGQKLAGAAEEVRSLARRYAGVTAVVDPPRGAREIAMLTLPRGRIVHVAAHAEFDARRPWRSGVLVGDPKGRDPWLRTADIARLRVPARLVVLASCRSVGGAGKDLTSMQGLAPAWMAAGVPSVLAAQWEVDDAATAKLMEAFYAQLARGASAATALRAAQRRLRDDPATAAPRTWAAFVVVGEPGTRVALAPRR